MAKKLQEYSPDLGAPKVLAAEFIGTLFLVLAAAGAGSVSGNIGGGSGGAWAATLSLVVLVLIFGPVSGGHFNPAISVGMTLSGRLPKSRLLPYVAAQLAGALAAGLILRLVLQSSTLGLTTTFMHPLGAIAIEVLLTFWLQWVILAVTEKDVPLLQTALAIGFALGAAAHWGGNFSGGSLNPARTLGPALAAGDLTRVWIYLIGPVLGAVGAAFVYRWYKDLR